MGKLHRARVVAVGSQQDMLRMVRAMLDNGDWLHEEEEYAPPETLQRRLEQVARTPGGRAANSAAFWRR